MAITLPTNPGFIDATPVYNSLRQQYRSPLTGKSQINARPGSYFGLKVQLPPMGVDLARDWIADLINGLDDTVIYNFPETGKTDAAPGTPLVNGGSQTGLSLVCDGFGAGYTIKKGRFFSVTTASGYRELKVVTAQAVANGSGQATLSFKPHLRASPADNAAVELATPKIEGLLVDNRMEWSVNMARTYGLSFTIEEVG